MSGPISPRRWQSTRPPGHRARLRAVIGTLVIVATVLQPGLASVVLADPISPVSVVKTASANPVASGAELTYTIIVTNLGSSKVDNVVMTDQVNGVGVIQSPPALPQLTITSSKGTCTQGRPEREPRDLQRRDAQRPPGLDRHHPRPGHCGRAARPSTTRLP